MDAVNDKVLFVMPDEARCADGSARQLSEKTKREGNLAATVIW